MDVIKIATYPVMAVSSKGSAARAALHLAYTKNATYELAIM